MGGAFGHNDQKRSPCQAETGGQQAIGAAIRIRLHQILFGLDFLQCGHPASGGSEKWADGGIEGRSRRRKDRSENGPPHLSCR
jgi:hypothetical protein